ncbi:MAG: shikimate dehydrogenase [Bacteroidota bacterium]|nr:shikimate dehydrogenase [Bacteroidota bacterium]
MNNSFHKDTVILGLIGKPISHSYSPLIYNITIELKKLDCIYLPFEVTEKQLKNAINGMIAYNIKGLNITIPYKESVTKYLDGLSEEASIIGAVNTISNIAGKLIGFNTDTHGIYESLLPYALQLSNKSVTLLGAGGASRAVIYTLIKYFNPSSISIINRTAQKGEELCNYFTDKMGYHSISSHSFNDSAIRDSLNSSALIINATPIGMYPGNADLHPLMETYSFTNEQIVFDLIYNPHMTRLLTKASKEGAEIISGLKMLICQAAKSFEIWTGEIMPVEDVFKSVKYMLIE